MDAGNFVGIASVVSVVVAVGVGVDLGDIIGDVGDCVVLGVRESNNG